LCKLRIVKKLNKKQGAGLTRPGCNAKMLSSQLLKKGKAVEPECLFNGLEVITSKLYPAVICVKHALVDMGLDRVMMSGSGSSVFAIYDSYSQAQCLSKKLHKQHKTWQVFTVSTT